MQLWWQAGWQLKTLPTTMKKVTTDNHQQKIIRATAKAKAAKAKAAAAAANEGEGEAAGGADTDYNDDEAQGEEEEGEPETLTQNDPFDLAQIDVWDPLMGNSWRKPH